MMQDLEIKDDKFWLTQRSNLVLDPDLINLNAGTASPTLKSVVSAAQAFSEEQAGDPAGFIWHRAPACIELMRSQLAGWLRVPARNLVFATNASWCVNTVMQSFPFHAGDELVMTDQEYHHYNPLWQLLSSSRGVRVIRVQIPTPASAPRLDPADLTGLFRSALTPRTRMLYFSHITSPTGLVLPAAELCRLAREHGALSFVDGAHAPGHVGVDLETMGADFYTANIHKWMMGAIGSAFLYAGDQVRLLIRPLMVMGGYTFDPGEADTPLPQGTSRFAFAHEYQGTRSLVPWLTIDQVLPHHQPTQVAVRTQRWRYLRSVARTLTQRCGLENLSHDHQDLASCMITWRWPIGGRKPDPVRLWLHLRAKHRLEVALGRLGDGTPTLRVSCAWFVTTAELEQLAQVLESLDWHQFSEPA